MIYIVSGWGLINGWYDQISMIRNLTIVFCWESWPGQQWNSSECFIHLRVRFYQRGVIVPNANINYLWLFNCSILAHHHTVKYQDWVMWLTFLLSMDGQSPCQLITNNWAIIYPDGAVMETFTCVMHKQKQSCANYVMMILVQIYVLCS